jgi:hypothetical protein
MIALAVLIPALAISLPLALAGSPSLNERTWQGWNGTPAVRTLAADARSQPSLGDSGDLWVSPDGTRLLTVELGRHRRRHGVEPGAILTGK